MEYAASKRKPVATGQQAEAPAEPGPSSSVEALANAFGELERQYGALTSRIAAVNTNLGHALDGEQRLVVPHQKPSWAGRRSEVSVRMAQIERESADHSERATPLSEQKATAVSRCQARPFRRNLSQRRGPIF